MPSFFTSFCTAGLLLAAGSVHAVTQPDFDSELRRIADTFMRDNHIPGMAIAITVDGKECYYNFGVASKQSKRKVSSDTLFELGSISKTFIATLATYAQAEGKLSLDNQVEDYLPEFKGKPFGKVALFDLGTHTAGGFPLQVPDEVGNHRQLIDWLKAWQPRYPEGSKRSYSNPSIGMLGLITADRMGQHYADAVEHTLLPKLGLADTFIRIPADKKADYAQGYNGDDSPVHVNPGVLGDEAYGVISSAKDLLHYVHVQLGETPVDALTRRAIADTRIAYYRSGPMIQDLAWEQYPYPVTHDDLLRGNSSRMIREDQPVTAIKPPHPPTDAVLVNKTGATNGFGAYIAFVPAKKLGLVILTNRSHPTEARVEFAYEVLKMMDPDGLGGATH